MARAPPQKKRKKRGEKIIEFFDYVLKAGPKFSPKTIQEYADIAMAAREQENEMKRHAVPKKASEIGELVFTRVRETRTTRHMTKIGLAGALSLAEQFELGKLNFRKWVES